MGWFSRSTAAETQEEQGDISAGLNAHSPLSSSASGSTSGSAATQQTSSSSPTVTLSPPTVPASEPLKAPMTTPVAATSNIQAPSHPETTAASAAAAQPVQKESVAPTSPVVRGMVDLDEYNTPDDMFARFKVADAMNELFACSSLGSNIRNYYRFGTYKDCAPRYDHLKFCLSLKTKSSQVAQVMIQRHDAELRAKKQSMPNSEDVWTARTHPPDELVELAREA